MEQIDKSIKFGYFQVFTNSGIGYVCVALKRPAKDSEDRKYRAGFSFCSPKDNSKFVKSRARNIATTRLNLDKNCVEGSFGQDTKLFDIFESVLGQATVESKTPANDFTVAPSWVRRAVIRGDVKFGLTQEQFAYTKAFAHSAIKE